MGVLAKARHPARNPVGGPIDELAERYARITEPARGLGVDLHGPVVVGGGCELGAGAMLRECVVLPGAEIPSGGLVVGGLYGIDPDRPLG